MRDFEAAKSIKGTIMAMLDIKNLSLSVDGHQILDNLSLELWEGYVHAIVGPNGAGKSTLSCTIMGLDGYRDVEGEIHFDEQPLLDKSIDQRAQLGITMAWQEPARFEGLTVRNFIMASSKDKSDEVVANVLEKVGLNPLRYMSRAVDKTLSGGERKKVELASILAMQPRLVMLDEPDSGIDVESLQRIKDAITILKEAGATILLVTHSMEVLSWAEHAFLMCHGKILDKGGVDKISQYFKGKCIPCNHKNLPQLNGNQYNG